jgi:hypothetical protein
MSHAEALPEVEHLTWSEICQRHPDRWVVVDDEGNDWGCNGPADGTGLVLSVHAAHKEAMQRGFELRWEVPEGKRAEPYWTGSDRSPLLAGERLTWPELKEQWVVLVESTCYVNGHVTGRGTEGLIARAATREEAKPSARAAGAQYRCIDLRFTGTLRFTEPFIWHDWRLQ